MKKETDIIPADTGEVKPGKTTVRLAEQGTADERKAANRKNADNLGIAMHDLSDAKRRMRTDLTPAEVDAYLAHAVEIARLLPNGKKFDPEHFARVIHAMNPGLECIAPAERSQVTSTSKAGLEFRVWNPETREWKFADNTILADAIIEAGLLLRSGGDCEAMRTPSDASIHERLPTFLVRSCQDDWDNPERKLVGIPGGRVFDQTTGKVIDATRDMRITKKLGAAPGGSLDARRKVAAMFRGALYADPKHPATFKEQSLVRWVRRNLGLALAFGNPNKVTLFIKGESNSGKTSLGTILSALLGGKPGYHMEINESIMQGRGGATAQYVRAELKGVLLATVSEVSANKTIAAKELKALGGGNDLMEERALYSMPGQHLPTHSLLMSGNSVPPLDSADPAAIGRLRIIEFSSHDGREDDPNFAGKFIANADLMSALLDFVIAGFNDAGADEYTPTEVMMNADEFAAGERRLKWFFDTYMDEDKTATRRRPGHFYNLYLEACIARNVSERTRLSSREFVDAVCNEYPDNIYHDKKDRRNYLTGWRLCDSVRGLIGDGKTARDINLTAAARQAGDDSPAERGTYANKGADAPDRDADDDARENFSDNPLH